MEILTSLLVSSAPEILAWLGTITHGWFAARRAGGRVVQAYFGDQDAREEIVLRVGGVTILLSLAIFQPAVATALLALTSVLAPVFDRFGVDVSSRGFSVNNRWLGRARTLLLPGVCNKTMQVA